MMPDCLDKEKTLILPSRYLGTVEYYALINAFHSVVIDSNVRFDKRQKEVHRCTVADTHGVKRLTVPIEKPVSMTGARWSDIVISPHDSWWHIHWETIKSAYGRTPFFEFYADDFAPFFTADSHGKRLTDFNADLDRLLRRLLYIESDVTYGLAEQGSADPSQSIDFRRAIPTVLPPEKPYYQVRSLTQGFVPGLSVVDLLFNLGPEAALYLDSLGNKINAGHFFE